MRNYFLRRNWRERALLLVTLTVGVALWLASLLGRFGDLRTRWTAARKDLENQATSLGNAPEIEKRLQSQLAQLKGAGSMNSNQFVAQLDTVVKKSLSGGFRRDPPTTERRPPVAIHTVSLAIEKAELRPVASFIDDLGASLPLVNIEQITFTPDRKNPAQLDVRMKLSSLELLP
jgi:hypothetical protein